MIYANHVAAKIEKFVKVYINESSFGDIYMWKLINDCFCLGHFGVINLRYPVINPHLLKEVATLLNKFCPGCKYTKKKQSQSQVQEFFFFF